MTYPKQVIAKSQWFCGNVRGQSRPHLLMRWAK
jgi:hypothetical protein